MILWEDALVRPLTNQDLEWKTVRFHRTDETKYDHPLWIGQPHTLTWNCGHIPQVIGTGWEVRIRGEHIQIPNDPPQQFISTYGDMSLSNMDLAMPDWAPEKQMIAELQQIVMELT